MLLTALLFILNILASNFVIIDLFTLPFNFCKPIHCSYRALRHTETVDNNNFYFFKKLTFITIRNIGHIDFKLAV